MSFKKLLALFGHVCLNLRSQPQKLLNFFTRALLAYICRSDVRRSVDQRNSRESVMSFFNMPDKKQRDEAIQKYLELKERLKRRHDKISIDEYNLNKELTRSTAPIIRSNESIARDIKAKLEPIERELKLLTAMKDAPKVEDYSVYTEDFLNKYDNPHADIDQYYGIRRDDDDDGAWKIGSLDVVLPGPDNMLTVGTRTYKVTPGLWSLITEKDPSKQPTEKDLNNYASIMTETHALNRGYKPKSKKYKEEHPAKWDKYLNDIWANMKTSKRPARSPAPKRSSTRLVQNKRK